MTEPLRDRFGRVHNNLRISVTDRCNIRCFYCMPAGNVQFMERSELLTYEELVRFVRITVPLGVNKVRITGGEPLVRKNVDRLVAQLADVRGIDDIGLTTNGVLLTEQAEQLHAAGLRRVNISLDTLDADSFQQITRRDCFEQVTAGIEAAIRVGFDPIKINAVAVRGLTDDQVAPLARFARQHDVEVRFIEYMPLDAENAWQREKVLFAAEILDILTREIGPLEPIGGQSAHSPATEFRFADGVGRIGLIASVSRPFCEQCNRFRLTADGKLRNCLFSLEETDVKQLLRSSADDEEIVRAVRESIAAKQEGHEINTSRFIQPSRPMNSIGG